MSESTISITFRGLSGEADLTLPSGATVADARTAAGINPGLAIRADGQTVADESAPLRDEQVLVATAPEAKHGFAA